MAVDEEYSVEEYEEDEKRDRRRGALAVLALAVFMLLVVWWFIANTAKVPDVVGMQKGDAREAIEDAGFKIGKVTTATVPGKKPGEVFDQDPEGGRRHFKGSPIDLQIVGGMGVGTTVEDDGPPGIITPEEPTVQVEYETRTPEPDVYTQYTRTYKQVPNVLSMSETDAKAVLRAAGYTPSVKYGNSTTDMAVGLVYYEDPHPGAYISDGVVVIWVSNGPPGGHGYPKP